MNRATGPFVDGYREMALLASSAYYGWDYDYGVLFG
ncbi:hypothetical protein EN962_18785 [Mesorhizobium sp. M7A.F.Ca.CA.001.09.2.1]|uniref:Uncharacterized protein n=1 Tax=Mesorhizobium ciceri biovar biserrulae (strain HAMBI 2942 / LMG 23838 / WSM1271) TaxID=765698 RepID=E8TMV2_MESCW|nr:hypothetical protein Mesci_0083 [Mesorhizobium ciceri biovar biserrulae WSM1271]RUU21657.1 hypothetical protein EOC84_07240 [Mesorhizobium sp. Primo-B]RUU41127.1 hypothetical protein EOC83_04055 [Mesorhizobium sp. Primo-A]RUX16445.1 hypothetical protein EN996_08885 [Mesorhizobium sp. M7A.F.Ca.CA.002.14.1.2]RUX34945.1 hypothetical protein EN994_34720 [Mesorhizobium sp. M7A.F.Ca.CA.002.09.1.1]RUX36783.1 hypothetical protein EN987_23360 [Mesorhizobium sp. M7A.F.Ca.CA.002.11.2.1]RUX62794.1 hyp